MINNLKNLGLSDNEAKVYLAMLELGPSSVLEIAAQAKVNRPTAYVQIEALKKMGLASAQTKKGKKLFIAESPTQFEFLLEREEKTVEQKRGELMKILPELQTLFNLGDQKPQVRFFEGKEGLIKMQEEFLKVKNKLILGISSADSIFKTFPDQLESYSPRRVARGIRAKFIYTSSKGPILKDTDQKFLRESKYVPPERFPFTSDITIFDNKVAISATRGRLSGTIIEHDEIAESFRALFNLLWELI